MKKILSILLTVILLFSTNSVIWTASAQDGYTLQLQVDFENHRKSWLLNGTKMVTTNDYSGADISVYCTDYSGKRQGKKITVFNDANETYALLEFNCDERPRYIEFEFGYLTEGSFELPYIGTYSIGGLADINVKIAGDIMYTEDMVISQSNTVVNSSEEYVIPISVPIFGNIGSAYTYLNHTYCFYEFSQKFPRNYNLIDDSYNFPNYFGSVSESIYQKMFGNRKGSDIYKTKESFGEHGLCYGIASTTASLLKYPSAVSSFKNESSNRYVSTISELERLSSSDYFGTSLGIFIKYAHIFQFSEECQKLERQTKNDLKGLYNATINYINGNNQPIVLNLYHKKIPTNNDHTVLVVGYKETSDYHILLINDSNSPITFSMVQVKEFKIKKDFSSWSYNGGDLQYSSEQGYFTYICSADIIYNIGEFMRDDSNEYFSKNNSLLFTKADIVSENDMLLISGVRAGESEENTQGNLYWLAENEKSLSLVSNSPENTIRLSDVNTTLEIELQQDCTADFYVNDAETSYVNYTTKQNDENNICFSVFDNGVASKIIIKGKSNADAISATQTESGVQVKGINNGEITLIKNDKVIATKTFTNMDNDLTVIYDTNSDNDRLEIVLEDEEDTTGDTKIPNCDHLCHKEGFLGFIWKIVRIFQKIFGIHKYCDCGVAHY